MSEKKKGATSNGFENRPNDINRLGRPKKLVSKLVDIGYTKGQINDTIQNIIGLTEEQLNEVDTNKEATILERIVAKALLKSYKTGSLYNLETLFSRVYGQPKQEVEVKETEQPIFKAISLDVEEAVIVEDEQKPKK